MQTSQNDGGSAAPRLLVIDDDKVQQIVLSKVRRQSRISGDHRGSVEQAIKEIENQPFECIILDLLLNGQNGILVLGEIAAHSSKTLLIRH